MKRMKPRAVGNLKRMIIRMILRTPWFGARLASSIERRRQAEVKHQVLRDYARKYGLSVLVETGTYLGGTVAAVGHDFERVYTIELDDLLFKMASEKFEQARNIEVIHGDSGVALRKLLPVIRKPALFWLDGHYSGGITGRGTKDTPILEELTAIFEAPDLGHVIIVDDAREFGISADYPSLDGLFEFIRSSRPEYDVVVKDDSIRATPRASERWNR